LMLAHSNDLEVAHDAAQAAANSLQGWQAAPEADWKGRIDPVTEADRQAEQAATKVLKEAYPNDEVVGEEQSSDIATHLYGMRRWYLDPLDGTTNFLRGRPHWCVSLALVDETDETLCAVVMSPPDESVFLGVRGKGATCNGRALTVTERGSIDRAVVGSGFPYSFGDLENTNLSEWSSVTVEALTVRCSGAAALDLCDVARGRLDAYWELGLESWDMAAGALIAREAGAMTTTLDGKDLKGVATEILAAPPNLHGQLLDAIGRVRAK